MALDPGKLRHKFRVMNPVQVHTGGGRYSDGEAIAGYVWASLEPLSDAEVFRMGRQAGKTTYRSRCWFVDFISKESKLVLGSRTFNVISCLNVDEANFELDLVLEEERG